MQEWVTAPYFLSILPVWCGVMMYILWILYMVLLCLVVVLELCRLGPVSLRLMTSQFKDIVTDTQKYRTVKCKFCGVWVPNFVWNFKGALWNFTQNLEPIHRKIYILPGVNNLTTYDILGLWHLKSKWDGPLLCGNWYGFIYPYLSVLTHRHRRNRIIVPVVKYLWNILVKSFSTQAKQNTTKVRTTCTYNCGTVLYMCVSVCVYV